MKRYLWISLWVGIATPCWSDWRTPLPAGMIERVDSQIGKAICRCEYYKTPNYGQLVFTRSCDLDAPKQALMKIDGASVKLSKKDHNQSNSDCKQGTAFKEVWSAPGVNVTIDGRYTGPGEESCWIKGSITVIKAKKNQTMPIEGACGI